jgi:hypothetical protein
MLLEIEDPVNITNPGMISPDILPNHSRRILIRRLREFVAWPGLIPHLGD